MRDTGNQTSAQLETVLHQHKKRTTKLPGVALNFYGKCLSVIFKCGYYD